MGCQFVSAKGGDADAVNHLRGGEDVTIKQLRYFVFAVAAVVLLCTMMPGDHAFAQTPSQTEATAPTAAPATGGSVPWLECVAMHGDSKYSADSTSLGYVEPVAPPGGDIKLSQVGTFDSLNPYILDGNPPRAVLEYRFYEYLANSPADEPFTVCGVLAEGIQMPDDRKWVAFKLRKDAKWSDGTPVTPDDVVYSFNTIMKNGDPFYQSYYGDVKTATKVDDQTVRFDFDPQTINRELPLIITQLPILQKAYWEGKDFSKPSLDIPVSSGPYKVDPTSMKPGQTIVLVKDPSYWGKDIWYNRSRHNFDKMQWDFYRDSSVALEAFKGGEYDWRLENSSKNWATAYDFPALNEGKVTKENIKNSQDQGIQGWVFNTRKDFFKDPKVREALNYAFDFDWTNANLTYNAYKRSNSFFSNSQLASTGLPQGEELAILQQYKDQLDPRVFTEEFTLPTTGGTPEGLRANLKKATDMLAEAGWTVKDGKLVDKDGNQMKFEIILSDAGFERLTNPFIENLAKLGVEATMRTVDQAQYQQVIDNFSYDMIINTWGESESPGNEQRNYWSSDSAKTNGTNNYAGVNNPAIDALVERVIAARSREDLVTATHALDRALLWGFYLVPQWYIDSYRVAYWNNLARPQNAPPLGLDLDTWFTNSAQAAAIREAQVAAGTAQPALSTEAAAAAAAATAGTVMPTEVATVAATAAVTSTTSGAPAEGGGMSSGTIALLGIGVLVLIGLAFWFMRRGQQQ
jgi:microcin C transport system substrate-binding protein